MMYSTYYSSAENTEDHCIQLSYNFAMYNYKLKYIDDDVAENRCNNWIIKLIFCNSLLKTMFCRKIPKFEDIQANDNL